MTLREAIYDVFRNESGVLTTKHVVARLAQRHPDEPWRRTSISTYLIGLSVNHGSARHHPYLQRHAFLVSLGNGRYRLPRAGDDRQPRRPRPRQRPAADAVELDQDARGEFVRRLVQELDEQPFQPCYRKHPYGASVVGWPARYLSYFWPDPAMDVCATAQRLGPWFDAAGALSERLQRAGGWSEDERREAACLAECILTWGRVPQKHGIDITTVEAVFRRALGMRSSTRTPMNSGWTKVAALATAYLEGQRVRFPHVIWDSRVSTALTSRLDRLLANEGRSDPKRIFPRIGAVVGRGGSRPRPLRLRWAHAYGSWSSQDAGSDLVREIRDVLNDNEGDYPPMPALDGGDQAWTIRGVESVLFMDGY